MKSAHSVANLMTTIFVKLVLQRQTKLITIVSVDQVPPITETHIFVRAHVIHVALNVTVLAFGNVMNVLLDVSPGEKEYVAMSVLLGSLPISMVAAVTLLTTLASV
jgi:hypothetical protein